MRTAGPSWGGCSAFEFLSEKPTTQKAAADFRLTHSMKWRSPPRPTMAAREDGSRTRPGGAHERRSSEPSRRRVKSRRRGNKRPKIPRSPCSSRAPHEMGRPARHAASAVCVREADGTFARWTWDRRRSPRPPGARGVQAARPRLSGGPRRLAARLRRGAHRVCLDFVRAHAAVARARGPHLMWEVAKPYGIASWSSTARSSNRPHPRRPAATWSARGPSRPRRRVCGADPPGPARGGPLHGP